MENFGYVMQTLFPTKINGLWNFTRGLRVLRLYTDLIANGNVISKINREIVWDYHCLIGDLLMKELYNRAAIRCTRIIKSNNRLYFVFRIPNKFYFFLLFLERWAMLSAPNQLIWKIQGITLKPFHPHDSYLYNTFNGSQFFSRDIHRAEMYFIS